jgi:pyruvate kinase
MLERKAKIVATIGPSCQDVDTLRRLITAGLDVARLNFSHGSHDDHACRIKTIRELSKELGKPVSILQDIQGPKLRVGDLGPEGLTLKVGEQVILSNVEPKSLKPELAQLPFIPFDVPNLVKSLMPGNRVLMDDGQLELEVEEVAEDYILAHAILAGVLKSHKGVNLPGANLDIPIVTEKDYDDIVFGLSQGIDFLAISFVRTAADVEQVRKILHDLSGGKSTVPIIAKLERPEAIENLHDIVHAADGLMVARGDLGVETSPAKVPTIQKKIIQAANKHAKIVITATQMLDSMIHNPRPTRAEASDVANAIFDGTDAIMLSGETASGSYPIESVAMMDTITMEAESHFAEWGHQPDAPLAELSHNDDAVSITMAARELAHDRDVAAIAVFNQTGHTALIMSKARPRVPIMAFTPELETFQRLSLYWNVTPFLVPHADTVESMLEHVENSILTSTTIKPGQQVILVTGFPVGQYVLPNFALLHTIREQK